MTNKNDSGFRNKLFIVLILTLFLILLPAAVYAESDPVPSADLSAGGDSTESTSFPESNTSLDSDPDTTSTEAPASESDDNHVDESTPMQSNEEQSENESAPAADEDCYVVELDVLDIANVNTEIDLQFTFAEVGDSSIGAIDIDIPDGFSYVDNGITINDLYSTNWIGSYNSDNHTVNVSRNSGVDAIFKDDDPISILFRVITPALARDGHEFTTAVKDADGNNNDMHESSFQPVVNVRDGSESSPFEIGNTSQLDDVRNYLNGNHFIQTADIDLGVDGWADGEGWVPIGNTSTKFSGSFDGNGYEISNLTVNRPMTDYQGLFGCANDAAISNLVLKNVSVQGSQFTGALAGCSENSDLTDIHVTGQVNGGQFTGGLVGGLGSGNLYYSSFNGLVKGARKTGGLAGSIDRSMVYYSYSLGSVEGTDEVGGLVGHHYRSMIRDSYSRASVNGGSQVGGLAGYSSGSSRVRTYIYNSYSSGDVAGTGRYVGGLVGEGGSYSYSYAVDSYWDIEASGRTWSPVGIGKNTAEMMQQDTFTNWNFDGEPAVWSIEEGLDYPNLVQTARSIALIPVVRFHDDSETTGNSFLIISNADWVAAASHAWITISGDSTGSNDGVISYNLGANSSTDPREGTITISGSSIEQIFTINQTGVVTVFYTVTYMAGVGGTINGLAEVVQTVTHGQDGAVVTAQPDEVNGYQFTDWSDSLATATRQATNVTGNLSYTANFDLRQYTVTYTAGVGGTVNGSSEVLQTVTHGQDGAVVTAQPDEANGYQFTDWSDSLATATRQASNVTGNLSYTANFDLRIDPDPDPDPKPDVPSPGFSFHWDPGFTFTLPPAFVAGGVLTGIPGQDAIPIITPAFVAGGSAADLDKAIAAYNQAKQSFEAKKSTMGAADKAVAETELAIANAAIKALEMSLATQGGQAVDMAALISAYNNAVAVLNANRALLTAEQIAAAEALLNAVSTVISRFSS